MVDLFGLMPACARGLFDLVGAARFAAALVRQGPAAFPPVPDQRYTIDRAAHNQNRTPGDRYRKRFADRQVACHPEGRGHRKLSPAPAHVEEGEAVDEL